MGLCLAHPLLSARYEYGNAGTGEEKQIMGNGRFLSAQQVEGSPRPPHTWGRCPGWDWGGPGGRSRRSFPAGPAPGMASRERLCELWMLYFAKVSRAPGTPRAATGAGVPPHPPPPPLVTPPSAPHPPIPPPAVSPSPPVPLCRIPPFAVSPPPRPDCAVTSCVSPNRPPVVSAPPPCSPRHPPFVTVSPPPARRCHLQAVPKPAWRPAPSVTPPGTPRGPPRPSRSPFPAGNLGSPRPSRPCPGGLGGP